MCTVTTRDKILGLVAWPSLHSTEKESNNTHLGQLVDQLPVSDACCWEIGHCGNDEELRCVDSVPAGMHELDSFGLCDTEGLSSQRTCSSCLSKAKAITFDGLKA